jgi:hypothetical protein
MDHLNFDNVNVEYDFTFYIYLQFFKTMIMTFQIIF